MEEAEPGMNAEPTRSCDAAKTLEGRDSSNEDKLPVSGTSVCCLQQGTV